MGCSSLELLLGEREHHDAYILETLLCAFRHTKKERGDMKIRVFLMVGIIAILISTATAIPGIATFYTQYVRKYL